MANGNSNGETKERLEVLRDLGQMLEKENLRFLAVKKLKELLNAKKTISLGMGDSAEIDDGAVQIKAVELSLAYCDGRPVERSMVIVDDKSGKSDEERAELLTRAMGLPSGAGKKLLLKKVHETNGNGKLHS